MATIPVSIHIDPVRISDRGDPRTSRARLSGFGENVGQHTDDMRLLIQ